MRKSSDMLFISLPSTWRNAAPLVIAVYLLFYGSPSLAQETPAVPVAGKTVKGLEPFDELMKGFVHDQQVPGAALAVAKDGKLIYARGFGYANREKQVQVQPDSLFRIASISKPITAWTILQLAQAGKLSLDDHVTDRLPLGLRQPYGIQADARWHKITIRQLLQHRGGWDRGQSIDAMFHSTEISRTLGTRPPADARTVTRFMLGWPLDFEPGTRYSYSNFGYCLLGRIIEQSTDQGYASYVRKSVLNPLDISQMRIGATLAAGQHPKEVVYYAGQGARGLSVFPQTLGQAVPQPYGAWHLEAMDAHGGWIGSAIDLVRFGSAVQHSVRTGLLTAESYEQMVARPDLETASAASEKTYYGLGWSIRDLDGKQKRNLWHTGSLPGTSTILVLRHDGFCWAALFNTRSTPSGKRPTALLDPLIHTAADSIHK